MYHRLLDDGRDLILALRRHCDGHYLGQSARHSLMTVTSCCLLRMGFWWIELWESVEPGSSLVGCCHLPSEAGLKFSEGGDVQAMQSNAMWRQVQG